MDVNHDSSVVNLNRKLVVSVSFAAAYGHFGIVMMPFQIGALIEERGLSASGAGTFGFFEVGALALVMFLVSSFVERFRANWTALAGMWISGAAYASIYFFRPEFAILCLLGSLAGIGCGLIYASLLIGASASPMADRVYALGAGGGLAVTVVLMTIIPLATTGYGADGVFLGMGVAMLCGTPTIWWFLKPAPSMKQAQFLFWHPKGAVALLALWFFFALGTGAIWSFAERVANHIAIAPATVGLIFSTSTFFSIGGTLLAAITVARITRLSALGLGIAGSAAGCLLLGAAWNTSAFTSGVLLYWLFYMYLYTYLLGTSAALDPTGRLGTAGGAFESLAFAVGAPAGGVIMDQWSSTSLGVIAALMCLAGIPLCIPSIRRALMVSEQAKLHFSDLHSN